MTLNVPRQPARENPGERAIVFLFCSFWSILDGESVIEPKWKTQLI